MKFSINADTIVAGTPVGRNCPLPPTEKELDHVWRALLCIAKRLGEVSSIVEVLQVHFHQIVTTGNEKYLTVEFRVVLVAPVLFPPRKMEASHRVPAGRLPEDTNDAAKELLRRIQIEIRRTISMAEESLQAMNAML